MKVVAVIEAATVTGPAKNLIEFCRRVRTPAAATSDLPIVESSLVTFHRGRAGPNRFVAAARASGIEVDVIEERFRFDTGVIGALREVIERRAPDIVQTHNVKSHFLIKFSGLSRRYRWIAFQHGYTATDLKMRLYNQLDRWSLPSADRVVAVCQAFAATLADRGVPRERLTVLHNAVRAHPETIAEELTALRSRLDIEPSTQVVVAVGRLSKEKGQLDLIQAFSRLQNLKARKVRLLLVGDGPERARIENAVRSLHLEECVTLVGYQADVTPFYAIANVLALPSLSEGSPNVLLEAMAAGLPAVATAVGGVPEIVRQEHSALLVPPRDARAMAMALDRLLTDAPFANRVASTARSEVLARFSVESYTRSVLSIYRDVCIPHAQHSH